MADKLFLVNIDMDGNLIKNPLFENGAIDLAALATDPLARSNHTGSQTASTISDFDTQVRTNSLDQLATAAGSYSMGGYNLSSVADPMSGSDAVNKDWVESLVNNALTGAMIFRGTVNAGDMDVNTATGTSTHVNGDMYKVTTGGSTAFGFQLNTGDFVVYNGTTWSKIDSTDPSVTGTSNRVTVTQTGDTSFQVDIASGYVGQNTITTLGTITTGVWSGTEIAVAKGGTGATSASGARTNLGLGTIATQDASNVAITGGSISGITDLAVADGGTGASTAAAARSNLGATGKYSTLVGDSMATSFTVTHSLGTRDVVVSVYDASTYVEIDASVTHTTSNTVVVDFILAPASDAYKVVVIG